MGGAEAVEEVDEGDAALDGSQVGHGAQVHDLLHIGFGQHGKAGLAAGHHVRVVAEDVQALGGHGTGRHVEDTRQQLAGDLVHVGDHQQQALGCGVGGGQSARRQRAVDSAGGTGLRLHFDDLDGGAEDVFLALGRPLVHIVGHGAGRRDGVDTGYLGKRVADIGRRVVAVHGLEFSSHRESLLSSNFLGPAIPPRSLFSCGMYVSSRRPGGPPASGRDGGQLPAVRRPGTAIPPLPVLERAVSSQTKLVYHLFPHL